MHFSCHKPGGDSTCCKHQASAPAPVAVTSVASLERGWASPQIFLTPVLFSGIKGASPPFQSVGVCRGLQEAHSPPQPVPLFILHSILLI
jgi:hypothetical protein